MQQFLKKKQITVETSHKWTEYKTRVWFFKMFIAQSVNSGLVARMRNSSKLILEIAILKVPLMEPSFRK